MPYFSRLTDIVTCNLTSLLERADDVGAALQEIISEMQQGVAGAERSVNTAAANVSRIEQEIGELRASSEAWVAQARADLGRGDEPAAKLALMRKREIEDLIAGLGQQLNAAVSTREHLCTTLNALKARLADALRRQAEGTRPIVDRQVGSAVAVAAYAKDRLREIDAELAALKRELNP